MKKLEELCKMVDLRLICPQCSKKSNESTFILKDVKHSCQHHLLVARKQLKRNGSWRLIRRRPELVNPSHYDVCRYYLEGFGCRRHKNRCTFAWSEEEAFVWTYARNHNIQQNDLKSAVAKATRGERSFSSKTIEKQQSAEEGIVNEFEGQFVELCAICFYSVPQQIAFKSVSGFCASSHKHGWSPLLVHILTDGNGMKQCNEIRPAKPSVHRYYCKYVLKGVLCRHGYNRCNFAHSAVELAVWEAEKFNSLNRSVMLEVSQQRSRSVQPEAKVVAESGVQFYCRICLVTFFSQDGFQNHCSSVEHAQMILEDSTVEWKHRKPPLQAKKYELCSRRDTCEFGDNCVSAHSHDELEEWIMRFKATRKRRRAAKQQGLISYQDKLLEDYKNCRNEVLIISEQIDGVAMSCDNDLRILHLSRRSKLKWNFQIQSQKPLKCVALLKREPGAMFCLEGEGLPKNCTCAEGTHFLTGETSYHVGLSFKATNFGIYDQWVVFDFGRRPVLVRKIYISIENITQTLQNPCSEFRVANLDKWHSGNRRIVPCMEKSEYELLVLQKYKPPSVSLEYKVKDVAKIPMTCMNYRERMHNFLFQEEQAETNILSRLSQRVIITVTEKLEDTREGLMIAQSGDLFAVVPLSFALTPDTNEGFLFKRVVKTALLALNPSSNNVVYEVAIIHEATTENRIALKLSSRCHTDLAFQKGNSHAVEIQFQLDRLLFCFRHQAVDLLPTEKIVFPDVVACFIPRYTGFIPICNQKQRAAMSYIAGQTFGEKPAAPLLIYGPFGTGKTFTLATSAMEILKKPGTKVLLCTDTNSAADLYVKEYFDQYVCSGHPEGRPLRIKYIKQNPSHTDPKTKQYCLISDNAFYYPDRSLLDKYQIVITTCTEAKLFQELKLPLGYFTHILIDEAAQMLECDALIPLALADATTRIVLAGDHMQATPKLFSVESSQVADHTLLNRLFQYYQKEKHEKATKSRIIFRENYRSVKEIIDFVSKHFYVGKTDAIQASGNVARHPTFYPLMFCHVHGKCTFDSSNRSWYNDMESPQVVEQVQAVLKDWPVEWGVMDPQTVCVLSEGTQVQLVRQELRKCGLRSVAVENVSNIQGRQFRVIIISTVHTRESSVSLDTCIEFFNDSRVLNTAMTRAQSLVIVVGDAVALCSVGKCSKIWKRYIQECIDKSGIYPEDLSMEHVKQAIADTENWASMEEDESDSDSCDSDVDVDPILQELLDESKHVTVTVTEEGMLDIVKEEETVQQRRTGGTPGVFVRSLKKSTNVHYTDYPLHILETLLTSQPETYRHCEIVMEQFYKGWAISLDDNHSQRIKIEGRVNCGRSFPGDQVLVEIQNSDHCDNAALSGKVVGVLKEGDLPRIFVCTVDEFDSQVMVPVNKCITKIYTPGHEKSRKIIAIRKRRKGKILTTGTLHLTEEIRRSNLFVVEILTWREEFYFPLGMVTKVLPAAVTMDQGLKILNLEYQVPDSYPKEVAKELAKCSQESRKTFGDNRNDCRNYPTFTVDPRDSKDLDDAISVRDVGEYYEIGVHITDVASFVPRGSAIDVEALKRGLTYYPPCSEPIHMLPPKLSQDLCSLLPGKDCRVISLFVLVQKDADAYVDVSFSRSVIRSDRKLSYEEAEDIIRDFSGSELRFDTLEDSIATAFHFSRVHRKIRLQEDCYYEKPDEHRHPGKRQSHQMIEELMIMMNNYVANFLINKLHTQNVTPLRCQGSPVHQQVANLESKHRNMIQLSLHLSHHIDSSQTFPLPPGQNFQILTASWNCLKEAALNNDFHKLIDFIATDDIHPQLAPVALELRKLMLRSFFIRSNSTTLSKQGHYSLNLDSYTWATSPIRRYLDIMNQRLLTAAICHENQEYTPQETDKLCHDFNRKNTKASAYEKKAQSLYLAMQLNNQVMQKLAFAVNVEPQSRFFKIIFPLNSEGMLDLHPIHYRSLQLVEQPIFDEKKQSMSLVWKKRVYCLETKRNTILPPKEFSNPHVTTISGNAWQKFVEGVKSEQFTRVVALLLEESRNVQSRNKEKCFGKIVVSKGSNSTISHYVQICLDLKNGDALQLQLATEIKSGFLVPVIQLLNITPTFEICVQHAENPITCFAKYASESPRRKYKNAKDYQTVWQPLCEMETASSAAAENEAIVIYDVKITWAGDNAEGRKPRGSFIISKKNRKDWQIHVDLNKCFLCIRCRDLKRNLQENSTKDVGLLCQGFRGLHVSEESLNSSELNINPNSYVWVAHAVTSNFQEDPSKLSRSTEDIVEFTVHQMSMDTIPKEVFQKGRSFVVEIISKLLPDIRKEEAVLDLAYSSRLVQCIALGQKIPFKQLKSTIFNRDNYDIPGVNKLFSPLNMSQTLAIREALQNPFTLIQGPPGTGKTVVGVHLVYWFFKMNEENVSKNKLASGDSPEKCILYCGPSNKSVDVVAEYLLKFRTLLKPLRIYSQQMENVDFPYPGSNLIVSRKSLREGKPKSNISTITLHRKIREPTNPFSAKLKVFDAQIQSNEEMTEDEVKQYKNLLSQARKYELKRHNVILCTCSFSSSHMLSELSVQQILVDESGMCTEPECLIPLVSHKHAEQIVLLGDHKQLQPIVTNDFCRRLGMEVSLFERHVLQARMLDVQYRMHREICQFPSEKFYEGKLKTGSQVDRRPPSIFCHRGSRNCPTLFGHLVGTEMSLVVSTEEGNENSRANKLEAEKAVHIVRQLICARVKPESIAILTPYNAQVQEINKLLNVGRITGVTVCTIIKSQGSEWRYVILSAVRSLPRKDVDINPSKSWLKKHLGFITDPNQVNVALTRAQEGLCILGNEHLLRCSNLWRDLLAHYRARNRLVKGEEISVLTT
uniref:Helicase with zinc finger 2 n=1 Tax=Callorhinchus milii TaxID=7868 RepID=A0A4W3ISV0_CALMI